MADETVPDLTTFEPVNLTPKHLFTELLQSEDEATVRQFLEKGCGWLLLMVSSCKRSVIGKPITQDQTGKETAYKTYNCT
jgi:hypothetical protein